MIEKQQPQTQTCSTGFDVDLNNYLHLGNHTLVLYLCSSIVGKLPPFFIHKTGAKVKESLFNCQCRVNFYNWDEGILKIIASYSLINLAISIAALMGIVEIRGRKGLFALLPANVGDYFVQCRICYFLLHLLVVSQWIMVLQLLSLKD